MWAAPAVLCRVEDSVSQCGVQGFRDVVWIGADGGDASADVIIRERIRSDWLVGALLLRLDLLRELGLARLNGLGLLVGGLRHKFFETEYVLMLSILLN